MKAFLSHTLRPRKFQRQLREARRKRVWTLLCAGRSQHVAGCNAGVDWNKFFSYLNSLAKSADRLRAQCGQGIIADPSQRRSQG